MNEFAPFPTSGPRGHAFLELGERLRRRGQLDAAATVASAGLSHYPALADAHDLLGRIRADLDDDDAATAAWQSALECDPGHAGARKGLAFLAFRRRDFAAAERQLEAAASQAPHDVTLLAALDRVRVARPASEESLRLDDPSSGLVLFDAEGMRLIGGISLTAGDATADAVAAEGAGFVRDAARAARLLDLGAWRQLVVEAPDARIALLPVGRDASLLVWRPATTPLGRLVATATRAGAAAREWLERMA